MEMEEGQKLGMRLSFFDKAAEEEKEEEEEIIKRLQQNRKLNPQIYFGVLVRLSELRTVLVFNADPGGGSSLRCRSAAACLLGLQIRIPLKGWMFIS
jgi:hypothetical protein